MGFDWPTAIDEDGDEYDLDFLCQINCAEISPFDSAGILPKTGTLCFFIKEIDLAARNFDKAWYRLCSY